MVFSYVVVDKILKLNALLLCVECLILVAFFLQRLEAPVTVFPGACSQGLSYVGLECNQLVQKYLLKIKGLAVCGIPVVVCPGSSGQIRNIDS